MKFKWKRFLAFVISALIVWGAVVYVDYNRVMNENEKPYFTYSKDTLIEDGGSGTYYGVFYKVEIIGYNSLTHESDFISFYLFGRLFKEKNKF